MIELFDDFTHVGLACLRLETVPSDRLAVVALNCALGESPDRTRIASLIFILLTLWGMDRLCFRDRDWRRILLWALHPIVLLPFFWASQITTSMTAFWGAVWALLYTRWHSGSADKSSKRLAALLVWSALGATVRMEAYAYGLVFLGLSWLAHPQVPWPLQRTWLRRFAVSQAAVLTALLAGKQAIRFLIPARGGEITMSAVVGDALEAANFYPHWVYPFLQLDSLGRYLEGLVFPWRLSFFGNWYHWWAIHENPLLSFLRLAVVAGVVGFAARALRNQRAIWRRLICGIAVFCGVTLLLSSLPRNDWYYPVRAYLGALCFFALVTPILLRKRSYYWMAVALFGLSTTAHLALHFSDPHRFRAYEIEFTGGDHPFMDLERADVELKAGSREGALAVLHEVYSKIPMESAHASTRAGTFWTLGLYQAWRIYDELGDPVQTRKLLGILSHSTFYPAVHACLQDDSTPVQECLKGNRKANFCNSFSYTLPKLPTRRPYRVDVRELCRFQSEIIQK